MAPWLTWRAAVKATPVALEVARQLDRRVRPHVLAYQLARSVDGVVGSWTDDDGLHWVVFEHRDGDAVRAFPPLSDRELRVAERRIDRGSLRSHRDLPEEAVRGRAQQVAEAPARLMAARRRRG